MLNFTKILSCFIYNMIWNCKNITKYGGFDFARVWNKFSRMASFNGQNILIHYTRGDLSSAPLKLSTTGIFTSKPLHAYILYLISEPIHACWIGSEILHNPSLSALLMNGTPRLGRPSLCAAEVWRAVWFTSVRLEVGHQLKQNLQPELVICLYRHGCLATGYKGSLH